MPKFKGNTDLASAIKYQIAKSQAGLPDPLTGAQPGWMKTIPRFGPGQQGLSSRPADMNQGWRESFGLPQGVTFDTQGALGGEIPATGGGINRFLRVIPYMGEQRPSEYRADGRRTRMGQMQQEKIRKAQEQYDVKYPFGNLYYPTIGDLLSTGANPIGISASGIIGPNTLQTGMPPFQGPPAPDKETVDWRTQWPPEEYELPPFQGPPAPLRNESEVASPAMPAYTGGYEDDYWPGYGGGGGGGGGGGYAPYPNRWLQQLYNWRL
jgi:hypothetical protein